MWMEGQSDDYEDATPSDRPEDTRSSPSLPERAAIVGKEATPAPRPASARARPRRRRCRPRRVAVDVIRPGTTSPRQLPFGDSSPGKEYDGFERRCHAMTRAGRHLAVVPRRQRRRRGSAALPLRVRPRDSARRLRTIDAASSRRGVVD